MNWCAQATKLSVRTNADTPEQTANAVAFGAIGIGLTRTEHMFFEGNRIDAMREMILADNLAEPRSCARETAAVSTRRFLRHLQGAERFSGHDPFPRSAAARIPAEHEGVSRCDLARKLGIPVEKIMHRVHELHEFNPMLGFRGCRLGIKYPEITAHAGARRARSRCRCDEAGLQGQARNHDPARRLQEGTRSAGRASSTKSPPQVQKEKKVKITYSVGTMIEIPRGALTADEIAQTAEFFSFGTNDLTQTCLGMSRDDSGSFLGAYTENEIMKKNPFASIDQTGVGQLMQIAVEKGNKTRPGIKLGICGEHGGDPDSVKFCHRARPDLRELLAVSRAGGASRGRASGHRRKTQGQSREEKIKYGGRPVAG